MADRRGRSPRPSSVDASRDRDRDRDRDPGPPPHRPKRDYNGRDKPFTQNGAQYDDQRMPHRPTAPRDLPQRPYGRGPPSDERPRHEENLLRREMQPHPQDRSKQPYRRSSPPPSNHQQQHQPQQRLDGDLRGSFGEQRRANPQQPPPMRPRANSPGRPQRSYPGQPSGLRFQDDLLPQRDHVPHGPRQPDYDNYRGRPLGPPQQQAHLPARGPRSQRYEEDDVHDLRQGPHDKRPLQHDARHGRLPPANNHGLPLPHASPQQQHQNQQQRGPHPLPAAHVSFPSKRGPLLSQSPRDVTQGWERSLRDEPGPRSSIRPLPPSQPRRYDSDYDRPPLPHAADNRRPPQPQGPPQRGQDAFHANQAREGPWQGKSRQQDSFDRGGPPSQPYSARKPYNQAARPLPPQQQQQQQQSQAQHVRQGNRQRRWSHSSHGSPEHGRRSQPTKAPQRNGNAAGMSAHRPADRSPDRHRSRVHSRQHSGSRSVSRSPGPVVRKQPDMRSPVASPKLPFAPKLNASKDVVAMPPQILAEQGASAQGKPSPPQGRPDEQGVSVKRSPSPTDKTPAKRLRLNESASRPASRDTSTLGTPRSNFHKSNFADGAVYERIGQVGEGTYGKVYKAKHRGTGEVVALKRIRMEQERDGFPITSMREIKLLQRLQHPGVVTLLEMMIERGSVYVVFEYMEHDLTGLLANPQIAFSPANIKDLSLQFFQGLAYLHQQGVLHRDLKASNILVNNAGELKLADFGLARFYHKNPTKAADYTNRVITLWFRPPELLLGATAYGASVDIWSAGCIFVELFTKTAPFPGKDEIHQLELIYQHMGTATRASWPGVEALPWFELVKPGQFEPGKFRERFEEHLSPAALNLAEQILVLDPAQRPLAHDLLAHAYFTQEEPAPERRVLSDLTESHEWDSKQRKREERRKSQAGKPLTSQQQQQQQPPQSSSGQRPRGKTASNLANTGAASSGSRGSGGGTGGRSAGTAPPSTSDWDPAEKSSTGRASA